MTKNDLITSSSMVYDLLRLGIFLKIQRSGNFKSLLNMRQNLTKPKILRGAYFFKKLKRHQPIFNVQNR